MLSLFVCSHQTVTLIYSGYGLGCQEEGACCVVGIGAHSPRLPVVQGASAIIYLDIYEKISPMAQIFSLERQPDYAPRGFFAAPPTPQL